MDDLHASRLLLYREPYPRLRRSNAKVAAIAKACGFGESINMYHCFRRHLKMNILVGAPEPGDAERSEVH